MKKLSKNVPNIAYQCQAGMEIRYQDQADNVCLKVYTAHQHHGFKVQSNTTLYLANRFHEIPLI